MLVTTVYSEEGIVFEPAIKGKPFGFPLNVIDSSITRDPDWNVINILEQLWYQGVVASVGSNRYLLSSDDFYKLDADIIDFLPITHFVAKLSLIEHGNVGSKSYKVSWGVIVRGKDAGRCIRKGVIVSAGGFDFLLEKHQYLLIKELEKSEGITGTEERARLQAKCKYYAEKGGIQLSSFMQKRDFLFSEEADIQVSSKDDRHIQIMPRLMGITEEVAELLPARINPIQKVALDKKNIHVFTSPEARSHYNRVGQIPEICDTEVPRFLYNPLEFIPEDIPFDEDAFSKRVKGLKIRRSAAAPFIDIEPDGEGTGWFDVNCGVALHDEDGEQPDIVVDENELLKAANSGQEYVYLNGTWIKLDPKAIRSFAEARKEIESKTGKSGKISEDDVRRILDIFDNINGIEYNENVLQFKSTGATKYQVSRVFTGKLRDYQQEGYTFLRSHYEIKTGVLLADDMGLGKTIQVIALFAYMSDIKELGPALIVMPSALIENWESELKCWLNVPITIYKHLGPKRFHSKNQIESNDVVLTTYETLAIDQVQLGLVKWSCVICDEVQKIKNFRTYAAAAVKGMNSKYRVALTGTPVENRLSELWSITDFVQPGLLSSYQYFRKTYEKPIQSGETEKASELINALSPVFLRRTKEAVLGAALPEKTEYKEELELNPEQRRLYHTIVEEVRRSEENIALGSIQKLVMLCSHPRLVSKEKLDYSTAQQLELESPKLKWTVDLLQRIQRAGEKAIIFTGYKTMQSILRQVLYERFRIDAKIINGEVKGSRLDIIDEFGKASGFNVLILSPRAAGVGLNIVCANHVIHYTREWNPAIENQATDRVYRIGQTKPVTVYYPVMKCVDFTTAEVRLDELLAKKRKLMRNVIVPSDLSVKWEEFRDII